MALDPGAPPEKSKLIPVRGPDGIHRLDRVRHRAFNDEEVRTSAQGRTKKECLDEWWRRFHINNRKGSKRKRASKRVQFAPTAKMSLVFAELDKQWKARVEDGDLSADTYSNYHRSIYAVEAGPKNHNPDAFKLETEMGNLSIVEAADAADITDYLDEVAEVSVSRAEMQHLLLGMAFRLAVLGRAIHTSENPMPHVLCPVRKPTVPRPITRQQAQDMYRYINELPGGKNKYMRLYFLFLLGTGVRPGEGLAIRWADLTTETLDGTTPRTVAYIGATVRRKTGIGTYRHPARKKGPPYRVALPTWLADELTAEQTRVRPKSEEQPVFRGPRSTSLVSVPSAQDVILRIRDASPLPDFRLSDLRDTVATHITAVTGDPERASAQLGHTDGNISIAQKYYIGADAKRLIVVHNAEHLELLNPLKMGSIRESGADSPDSTT